MKMKLIDRHVLRNFLVPFAYILVSVLGLFLAYDVSSKTARFLRHHVPFSTIFRFYSMYIPQLIALGLPMITLLAVVLGIGRMTRNYEITAMRSCGVSVLRIALPILVTGVLFSAISFVLFEEVVSRTFGEMKRFEEEIKGRANVAEAIRGGHFLTDETGSLLTFEAFDPGRKQLDGVRWESETDSPSKRRVITAEMAVWIQDAWWAGSATVEYPDGTYTFHRKMKMYDWRFLPTEIKGRKFPEEMQFGELRQNIVKYKTAPQKVRELRIQVNRRVALPLLNLVVVLVALPFAVKSGKRGGSVAVGVGISMLLCLAYYGVTVLLSLVKSVPPWAGVWLPNILFGAGGGAATFRLD